MDFCDCHTYLGITQGQVHLKRSIINEVTMWLFAIFVGIPIVEIALFIAIGGSIGLLPTLGTVILTAAAGTWLVRAQGLAALQRLRLSLAELRDPSEPLAHGAMVLIAGVLLLTPGFLTDATGFALLVSPVRATVLNIIGRHIRVGLGYGTDGSHGSRHCRGSPDADIIDADFRDIPASDNGSGDGGRTQR